MTSDRVLECDSVVPGFGFDNKRAQTMIQTAPVVSIHADFAAGIEVLQNQPDGQDFIGLNVNAAKLAIKRPNLKNALVRAGDLRGRGSGSDRFPLRLWRFRRRC